ncbi:unnamed protein product, partial [Nesidiocoris tenuis]
MRETKRVTRLHLLFQRLAIDAGVYRFFKSNVDDNHNFRIGIVLYTTCLTAPWSEIQKLTTANKGTGIIYKIRCNVIVRPCFKTYYSIFGSRMKLRLENLAVCRFS